MRKGVPRPTQAHPGPALHQSLFLGMKRSVCFCHFFLDGGAAGSLRSRGQDNGSALGKSQPSPITVQFSTNSKPTCPCLLASSISPVSSPQPSFLSLRAGGIYTVSLCLPLFSSSVPPEAGTLLTSPKKTPQLPVAGITSAAGSSASASLSQLPVSDLFSFQLIAFISLLCRGQRR